MFFVPILAVLAVGRQTLRAKSNQASFYFLFAPQEQLRSFVSVIGIFCGQAPLHVFMWLLDNIALLMVLTPFHRLVMITDRRESGMTAVLCESV